MIRYFFILFLCSFAGSTGAQKTIKTDVLVVGGGVGGTAAALQSARLGVKTLLLENTPWLGGMISAAGVSATDGNHDLPSGIWNEFRNDIYKVYGGPEAVATGWVSNTQFEPHVADSILKRMAAKEKLLTVLYRYSLQDLSKKANKITSVEFRNNVTGESLFVQPKIVIDATELGDVMKAAGVKYDLGMDADSLSGENIGISKTANIVQDLTYVAILKDYGVKAGRTIAEPEGYDPAEFDGSCTDYYHDSSRKAPTVTALQMLDYGKLPNGKYMLNWPIYGNDTYLNVVEMTEAQRQRALRKARQTTLRFVYFIQHQLGFKNLGLADDEFPTSDSLALIPYHREGRRVKGLVRLTMRSIAEPFTYGDPLYRTGISVGDYPIDHHHKKNPAAPQHLSFYPIPSYNIPLGALIPENSANLVVAEKGISVSNVANGTTRLQPVVMLTGQAAGTLAALSVAKEVQPIQVPVRTVQEALLKAKAYLMPYIDVKPDDPHFEAIQRIGATGILKGKGVPNKWANQTWFYPDSLVNTNHLANDLHDFTGSLYQFSTTYLTITDAIKLASNISLPGLHNRVGTNDAKQMNFISSKWKEWGLSNFNLSRNITRAEFAVLLNNTSDPFKLKAVNHKGEFISK